MRILPFLAVLVIILFCAQPVQAQLNKDYSFSLCPQFGFFYGHAEEIVYPTNTKAELLSLLIWDMKPVFYYGFLMDFSPVKPMERLGFFLDLSLKFGIPGPSGVMEDKDWMSTEITDFTNYSIHDNITEEIFLLDFSAGLSVPVCNIFLVKPFINISYMNLNFYGENGSGIYALYNPPGYSFSGKVINYSQEWFFVAPGVSVGYGYNGNLSAEISFMITPLVSCLDLDEHIQRNIQFRDTMTGGIMIEPGLRLFLAVSKWLGISFDISWRYIGGTRGPTYMRLPIGFGNYKQEGEAGAGLSILNTALLLKVKL